MIRVKEFINYQDYQESQEQAVNKWLQEQGDAIEIVDIKYSVGAFQTDIHNYSREFSGVLIIYKVTGGEKR